MDWIIAGVFVAVAIVGNTALEHHLRKKRARIEAALERRTDEKKEEINRRLQQAQHEMHMRVVETFLSGVSELRDDDRLPGDEWKHS